MPGMDALDATDFAPRASAPSLADDEVHVWSVAVDATLSPSQIGAAAQAALTGFLCGYADCVQAPLIERGVHGKPFAPALPDLHFNLSHAGPHLLLAFARGQALGVDLERLDRRLSIEGIAGRFFAAREAQALAVLPAARQRDTFLRLWTHKEAVLKAIGRGLNFGLDRVEFALDQDGEVGALLQVAEEAGTAPEWIVRRIDPAPGLLGALAWRGAERRVRTFTWPP
jgi:4'-phosphopantetheinyl transferase